MEEPAASLPAADSGPSPPSPARQPTEAANNHDLAATTFTQSTSHTQTSTPSQPTVAESKPALADTAMPNGDQPSAAAQNQSEDKDADPVVYGTRSRNRHGGARPNYSEDQEMDFEYSAPVTASTKSDATDAKARPVDAPASDSAPTAPGNNTKKRKAAHAAAVAPTTSQQNGITPPTHVSTIKKSAHTGPPPPRRPETNVMFFDKTRAKLNKAGQLVADDGTVIGVDDHVYLICEPPGDPYYLCRIMEFIHTQSNDPASPVESLRVNWFYRPRDVQRYNNDTRLVYGTMHSDICPLTSLRGKCVISHRSDIDDLDQYRKQPNHFWFNQIFDRFIRRWYEVIPTSQVINVPEKVKKALDDRWRYIAVEASRVKELTSAVKLCKRCSQYCPSSDSVDCAMCGTSYHMKCVNPPLPKKPSRGFAWACGPCSRAQEKKLEARHDPRIGADGQEIEDNLLEEEEEGPAVADSTRAATPENDPVDEQPATEAEMEMVKLWPMRYLGIHCRVEDALQYDDRAIYPRASSRLGPRHQANVGDWHGRPLELVKPLDVKKKMLKSGGPKNATKLSKDSLALIEADRAERAKRPAWVQDEPAGYVARGEDYPNDDPRNTAKLLFKMPEETEDKSGESNEKLIDKFVTDARGLAKKLRVADNGCNLMDKALSLLVDNEYESSKALDLLSKADRGKDLKEPIFTHDDLRKFEEGVSKYGSEHRLIKLHMKTHLPVSSIIRFYYLWKKTDRGKQIWGNYGGRKNSKKRQLNVDEATKVQQQVADEADDSAFDSGKAATYKKEFQCKFCNRKHSPQWRRAPGVSPGQTAPVEKGSGKDKHHRPLLALCLRCAGLWRKYAITWEEQDEIARKVAQGGGKAWKRRVDEELLKELQLESNYGSRDTSEADMTPDPASEPVKKKAKIGDPAKSKLPAAKPSTPPPPPIIPEQPRWRDLPCFVCKSTDSAEQRPISCTHCKLTVHKHCYGLAGQNIGSKWVCDQCTNDRTPLVSIDYACNLCPIDFTPHELWEGSKITHKKKTDRDREREKMEKDLLDKAKQEYTKRQAELNRPLQPREPLKITDGNNWVHVLCAVWTPEVKFSNAKKLERAEGFSSIPLAKWEAMCKLCKGARHGACSSCLQCHGTFHIACAFEAGYTFGFDVTPVKGSRKDQTTIVTLGQETGQMSAAIWCRDHTIKTIVHPMNEVVDDKGTTALQVYVENYKQADQTLTGTARKANLLSQSVRTQMQGAVPTTGGNRRVSTVTAGTSRKSRNSIVGGVAPDDTDTPNPGAVKDSSSGSEAPNKKCAKCGNECSPKWWALSGWWPGNGTNAQSGVNGILNKPLGIQGLQADQPDAQAYECHKCHHKMSKPPRRVPLSPKHFNVNMEWPPCLSEPLPPIWPNPPPEFHRGPDGQVFHRDAWQFNNGQGSPGPPNGPVQGPPSGHPPPPPGHQFQPPPFNHHTSHPGPPPLHSPPANMPPNGPPFVHRDGSVPLPHQSPHQVNGAYFDRSTPRPGPPPPMMSPGEHIYGGPPGPPHFHKPPMPPPPPVGAYHQPPPQLPPPRPTGPSPSFAPRTIGSPFGGPPKLPDPSIPPPHAPPGQSPVPSIQSLAGSTGGPQPSTPKGLEHSRTAASNSPHIGNLLS